MSPLDRFSQPELYSRKSAYTFGRTLGAGSFGVVRQARNSKTGEDVAIKIMLKKTLVGHEQLVYDELKFLLELLHPHIVGFRDWFELRTKFYVVTQLATGGELFDRIIELGHFTENDARSVMKQVVEAVAYLHNKGIVHRDVKPENILYLNELANLPIVLADFGIAKKVADGELITQSAGLFGYAAPEVLRNQAHGKPCDVWLLGVITYTLLCGYAPFRLENPQDFLAEVANNNAVIFHERYWKHVSVLARKLIIWMLELDPLARPTCEQILRDEWFATQKDAPDLLPSIREGFNARNKLRQVIELVMLNNRISKLREADTEDDDDDFAAVLKSLLDVPAVGRVRGNSFSKFTDMFKKRGAEPETAAEPKPAASKDSLHADTFQKLVQTALSNKDRVQKHEE